MRCDVVAIAGRTGGAASFVAFAVFIVRGPFGTGSGGGITIVEGVAGVCGAVADVGVTGIVGVTSGVAPCSGVARGPFFTAKKPMPLIAATARANAPIQTATVPFLRTPIAAIDCAVSSGAYAGMLPSRNASIARGGVRTTASGEGGGCEWSGGGGFDAAGRSGRSGIGCVDVMRERAGLPGTGGGFERGRGGVEGSTAMPPIRVAPD